MHCTFYFVVSLFSRFNTSLCIWSPSFIFCRTIFLWPPSTLFRYRSSTYLAIDTYCDVLPRVHGGKKRHLPPWSWYLSFIFESSQTGGETVKKVLPITWYNYKCFFLFAIRQQCAAAGLKTFLKKEEIPGTKETMDKVYLPFVYILLRVTYWAIRILEVLRPIDYPAQGNSYNTIPPL